MSWFGLGLGVGTGPAMMVAGQAAEGLLAKLVAWPEPTAEAPYADAHTGTDWVPGGTVGLTAGAFGGRAAWDFTGSGRVEAAVSGRPIDLLDGDWAVAFAVRRRVVGAVGAAKWHAVFGNGGTGASDPGINVHFHGTKNSLRASSADGVAADSEYMGYPPQAAAAEWCVAVVNFDHASGTVRLWKDGEWYESTDTDELAPLQGASVTTATALAWGSRKAGANSYGLDGEVVPLGVYGAQLTHTEALFLYNRGSGVSYADVEGWASQTTVWALAGLADGRDALATVRAPKATAVALRAYDEAGTAVATGTAVAPDADGVARPTVTCPADLTAYTLVPVCDGVEQVAWPMRVVTQPAGAASFRALQVGCQDTSWFTPAALHIERIARTGDTIVLQPDDAPPVPLGLPALPLAVGTWNGDFHYEDPTTADEALAALDLTLNGDGGQHSRRQIVRSCGFAHVVDNHELNVGGAASTSNPDKNTPGTAEMVALYRRALPGRGYGDDGGAQTALYRSQVWGRTRWIWLDTRSERDVDAGLMVSPTQLAWAEGELTAARVAGQVPVLVSGSPWNGGQADTWGTLAPAQRTALSDRVQAEHTATDGWYHCLLLMGDYHALHVDTFKSGTLAAAALAGATSVTVDVDPGVRVAATTGTVLTIDPGLGAGETRPITGRTDNLDGTWTLALGGDPLANSHTAGTTIRTTGHGAFCTDGTAPISAFHSGRLAHTYGGADGTLAADLIAEVSGSYLLVDVGDDGTTLTTTVRAMEENEVHHTWSRSVVPT